MCAAVFFH